VHVEPDQVADPVREKQRSRTPRRKLRRVAGEDAERYQAFDDHAPGDAMDLRVTHTRTHRVDGRELRCQHDLVQGALRRTEATGHRPRTRHVPGPALRGFGADVGQKQVPRA
jgi:hypothetical protein